MRRAFDGILVALGAVVGGVILGALTALVVARMVHG